jgi:hypothetical protein
MDKDKVIAQVANDILNNWNLGQIVNVLRQGAINQATSYYEGLSDQDQGELVNKILAAEAEAKAQAEAPQETEEPVTS